ncbi:LPS assembly lipoprotein LptE [Microvirga massiliensis]|uniref:LPS assembly lipoprotein LptE n=1 Tax=Microvirga massiliensis TaxID=1033741 RepID=UPI00062B9160|nr:LPS assembly lipoprotein LptE [Microvirga massiliensis]
MSSPDRPLPSRRSVLRTLTVTGVGLPLGACFRPLYGPTASGERLDDVMATVDVAPIVVSQPAYDRFGHYLRNELIFALNGSGRPMAKRYRLTVNYDQQVQSPIINTVTGRAETANVTGTANYALVSLADNKPITSGKAIGHVSYDRSPQRFATVRAARDAEIRLAKVLSDQLRTRLATAMATRA